MARAFNFSPGPATLPEAVLLRAQAELLEYRDCGASVLEISHRGADFMELAQRAEADLRALLSIPDDYAVLFTSGGATTVQALLPLNFAAPGQAADYVVSGHWGKTALRQAATAVDARVAASSEGGGFRDLPERQGWMLSPDAAYLHLTANETIHGVEWRQLPEFGQAPVIADFSSSIASEPLDVAKFGAIYAGAQKNLGPAGITVLIVRPDLLEREGQPRAPVLDYRAQAKAGSMLNTPPTWNWYLLGLCLRWTLDQGGVDEFARRNARKAASLYAAIDGSGGYYRNEVAPRARSRMNVPFFLHDPALDATFIAQAREAGLIGLKGHRVLGGMRVSLYNALPEDGVRALIDFMQEFQKSHG
ncbi:3-phosphoserine/phosphohydroxythreonine transaminase [Thermomonas sp.]|uniref:3-phosphoserine/phosphohydroxythreonine transaminase n=1 Tax=Thermomonas sp. TaxID=1971895 RepID=UPI0026121A5A|nr:3-phosphoserine/phosphohydroxythreonine transaminase [Thermomonas sp.]